MACMLRGLWIFHAESDVRLLMSRRFPTVEKKMQRLLGDDYVALPSDEDINILFICEILHEEEDQYIPPEIPEPFRDDFQQGSFAWNAEQEAYAEKLWPMGPVCSICNGKIWPVLFLFKKGFYLVTVVALEKPYDIATVRALDLPEITSAFAVLEDIADFIPANLTISDVAGISELQYYIRSAIPFGSPMNTNYQLLRKVRHGFPNKEDDISQRSPAWKPYLYKGKSKLTISVVETVNCTLYGKPDYADECFIAGTVYCCADIPGIPEISVPISYQNEQGKPPEVSVHNSAHVVGGIKAANESAFKISCTPPTGPFVLCRYRYERSPVVPLRGFYQIKEMSPVEFRLLLQIQFHPMVGSSFWSCQVRLPFQHRGVIKSHDLKCSGGSFSLTDHGQSILWNLNVRRPRGNLEANLLGELIFEAPQSTDPVEPGGTARTVTVHTPQHTESSRGTVAAGGGHPAGRPFGDLGGGASLTGPSVLKYTGAPQLGVGGTLMANKGNAVIIGSALTPSGGLMYAKPPAAAEKGRENELKRPIGGGISLADAEREGGAKRGGLERKPSEWASSGEKGRGAESSSADSWNASAVGEDRAYGQEDRGPREDRAKQSTVPTGGFVQDPFLHGVNCYAEVFMEIPDTTLSGLAIDPKAVTVYPTTRIYGGVSVHKEVLTGKYVIWNSAGEVRASQKDLVFNEA
eukprot:gnl/MRDRNA2_/MRDRNA2_27685_c0_seq1.p1 gnl/MRDRNA2_/MRDRNA2_27685_c0~~gnl/MRDRNA2_/MRDRNA2_27685_c0_seq1.p1  ORF type:complete len:691 (-),score=121.36 gnl/MRDRNA2_/MRDRNA2_27685_c0_seq1:73-2145(-)